MKKKTLLVYCEGDYYEPLSKVKLDGKKWRITKFLTKANDFDSADWKNSRIIHTLKLIKNHLLEILYIKKQFKKEIYNYERNISFTEIYNKLKGLYPNIKQIVNSNHKVIGLLVIYNKNNVYIPCKSSSINLNIPYELVTNLVDKYMEYEKQKKNYRVFMKDLIYLVIQKLRL